MQFNCSLAGANLQCIAQQYDTTATYKAEDVVEYNGTTYICNEGETAVTGAWDSSKWTRTYVADLTQYNSNLSGLDWLTGYDSTNLESNTGLATNKWTVTAATLNGETITLNTPGYAGGCSVISKTALTGRNYVTVIVDNTPYNLAFNGNGYLVVGITYDSLGKHLIIGVVSSKTSYWNAVDDNIRPTMVASYNRVISSTPCTINRISVTSY